MNIKNTSLVTIFVFVAATNAFLKAQDEEPADLKKWKSNWDAFGKKTINISTSTETVNASPSEANSRWLMNMDDFVKEVNEIYARSEIPPITIWKSTATGLRRPANILYSNSDEIGVVPTNNSRITNEFSRNLVAQFPSGRVRWKGKVKEAIVNADKGEHVISVEFPPTNGKYVISPLELRIPFERLPRNEGPAQGTYFVFSGNLHGTGFPSDEPIAVAYLFDQGPDKNWIYVRVSLTDVVPDGGE
ncbi:MAG: hypothetical protein WCS31_08145 [Verrucomicrobiae bacterium]